MHKGLFASLSRALERAASQKAVAAPAEQARQRGTAEHELSEAWQGSATAALSAEGMLVGHMLKRDFEKYGNHLGCVEQRRLAKLTDHALQLGMAFGEGPRAPVPTDKPAPPARAVQSADWLLWSR